MKRQKHRTSTCSDQLKGKAPTSLSVVPCGDEQRGQLVLVMRQQTGDPVHCGTYARE